LSLAELIISMPHVLAGSGNKGRGEAVGGRLAFPDGRSTHRQSAAGWRWDIRRNIGKPTSPSNRWRLERAHVRRMLTEACVTDRHLPLRASFTRRCTCTAGRLAGDC
jgi:hypothetical protein